METRLFQQWRHRLAQVAGLALVASLGLAFSASSATNIGGYGWPVRPFDRPHPIRSTFGDPRTLFRGPPTRAVLYRGAGVFSFHTGVDIAAPDGTPVYPVDSGVVVSTAACKVIVRSAGGLAFQYWHIVPAVSEGEAAIAYKTVLGWIRKGYGHVHLVELHGGHPTNPLAPGHLTPYRDITAPVVGRIEFRHPGDEDELMPELLRGLVEIDAPVSDIPSPSAPGEWRLMPTMPAVVRWRVERARDGQVVLRERTSFDVRTSLPRRPFWTIYARGTRQNDPTFRKHRYWRQEGWFLLRLGVLDTRRLKDGIYRVVVTARDIGDNTAQAQGTFLVYNHRLWPPETKQA
jgi:hypothetical protein